MACWIWTFGSAFSSIFEENAARKYRQALTKGLAICSRPTRDVDTAQAATAAPGLTTIVSPPRGGFHRPAHRRRSRGSDAHTDHTAQAATRTTGERGPLVAP